MNVPALPTCRNPVGEGQSELEAWKTQNNSRAGDRVRHRTQIQLGLNLQWERAGSTRLCKSCACDCVRRGRGKPEKRRFPRIARQSPVWHAVSLLIKAVEVARTGGPRQESELRFRRFLIFRIVFRTENALSNSAHDRAVVSEKAYLVDGFHCQLNGNAGSRLSGDPVVLIPRGQAERDVARQAAGEVETRRPQLFGMRPRYREAFESGRRHQPLACCNKDLREGCLLAKADRTGGALERPAGDVVLRKDAPSPEAKSCVRTDHGAIEP